MKNNFQITSEDTLLSVFQRNIEDEKGIVFITGVDSEEFVPYATLYKNALRVLFQLQKRGVPTGTEIVLQIENEKNFLEFFWACLLGKYIAVPLSCGGGDDSRRKVGNIWKKLNNPFMVGSRKYLEKYFNNDEDSTICSRIFFIEDFLSLGDVFGTPANVSPNDIAYLQYSSGSTGTPKGVVLTHRNLIANTKDIIKCANISTDERWLSWVPLTHDLGLVGFHLTSVLSNTMSYLMSTSLFIRRPLSWMQKVNEYRATMTFSPNYGYEYFMSAFNNTSTPPSWDLSCVRLIVNGAEVISKKTCDRFLDALQSYGLNYGSMFTVYGMAEACVAIAFPEPEQVARFYALDRNTLATGIRVKIVDSDDRDRSYYASVGLSVDQCSVRICNDDDVILADGIVGNIQVEGANITNGYYNSPELNDELFTADNWLRTGDLGVLIEGNLVVTGRKKEMFIINGKNYYPRDIHEALAEIEFGGSARVTACAVYDPELEREQFIVFVVFKKSLQDFLAAIRIIQAKLSSTFGITADKIVKVKAIPKTTSGKVQQYKLREAYISGAFDEQLLQLEELIQKLQDTIEDTLVAQIEMMTGHQVSQAQNLFEFGVSSVVVTRLLTFIQHRYGVQISIHNVFQNPSVAGLCYLIRNAQNETQHVIVERNNLSSLYDLSHPQRRLWILNQFEQGMAAYNLPIVARWNGDVSFDALRNIIQALVNKHESLRTVFTVVDGVPKQRVLDVVKIENHFDWIDLTTQFYKEEQCDAICQREAVAVFDLENGPLIRGKLIKLTSDQSVLALTMHHLIVDGYSIQVLFKELLAAYDKSPGQREISSAEFQYRDFVAWQKRVSETAAFSKARQYWQDRLAGQVPVLTLPTLKPRPAIQTFNGASYVTAVPQSLLLGLKQLSQKGRTTLFTTLASIVNVLLCKYTEQTDIIVGTPSSGRGPAAFTDQIGLYLNTLPLRTQFNKDNNFLEVQQKVSETIIGALEHQVYPFDLVVEDLGLQRDISRPPVFNVFLVFQDLSLEGSDLSNTNGSVRLEPREADTNTCIVDLFFEFFQTKDKLDVTIKYNTDLFIEEQIHYIASHLINLMKQVVIVPTLAIKKLIIIGGAEREKLLLEFNETKSVSYSENDLLVKRFERLAELQADRVAVVCGGAVTTYGELNRHANRLANFFLACHLLSTDNLVAIVMDRSEKMIASILGIWKCSSGYVPIDPEYPIERMAEIIRGAQVKLIVCEHEDIRANLSAAFEDTRVISLDEAMKKEYDNKNLGRTVGLNDLAYVIFTSGSTGKPKGVMIEHVGMINHIDSKIDAFNIDEESIIIQNASQCFDISVWQFFASLVMGGKVVIPSNQEVFDIDLFVDRVEESRASILELVPSYLIEILDVLQRRRSAFSSLNFLILNAETLKPSLVKRWFELYPKTQLVNTYGATEVSDDMSHYIMDSLPDTETTPVLRRPIQNFKTYIVDSEMNLVPIGVKGEVCIAGIGTGRGYINQHNLTKKVFVEDRFDEHKKYVLYKTGDIGRYSLQGHLELFGRKDHQVKVNGHRIELSEVESKISAIDVVKNVAAEVRQNAKSQNYLRVYLTLTNKKESHGTLQRLFESKLPAYMVPSEIIVLDKIPLNENGKINRKALAEINAVANEDHLSTREPQTKTESVLWELYKTILGIGQVDIHDNFFVLGGHSLKAAQIISHIHKYLNIQLQLRDIFLFPTVYELAAHIDNTQATKVFEQIAPIQESDYYEVSSAQKRLWILSQFDDSLVAYNSVMACEISGDLDLHIFRKVIHELVARHEILRTTFSLENGELRQKVCKAADFDFSITYTQIDPSSDARKVIDEMIQQFASIRYNFETGPLFRVSLLANRDQHIFLCAIHHIISDGWSMGVILHEISTLYDAYCLKREHALPALSIQYKDFSAWQNNVLKNEGILPHRQYWWDKFSGDVPVLKLATDFPRPTVKTYNGDHIKTVIACADANALRKIAQSQDASLFMALLSVVKVLLYKYSGQTDLIVGSPIAGREHLSLERQIGFYVNTIALRTHLNEEDDFIKVLSKVKDNALAAFAHQVYPFEKLVEDLNLDRDMSRFPLFDVNVALQNTNIEGALFSNVTRKTGGVTIKGYEVDLRTSKFDLIFDFMEQGEEISFTLEYNTDLFTRDRAVSISNHFKQILQAIHQCPEEPIQLLQYLAPEEKQIVVDDFNQTRNDEILQQSIVKMFEDRVRQQGADIAIVSGSLHLTYQQLDEQVNRLANFISTCFDRRDGVIGILLENSPFAVISMFAALKARIPYLPLDPQDPYERLKFVAKDSTMRLLISRKAHLRVMNKLQWDCGHLKNILCVDSDDFNAELETTSELMSVELWDMVAEDSTNEIEGGGWVSSYTGEDFSELEMHEYSENVMQKVLPFLSPSVRVLEIGCSSGITLFKVAPYVAEYVGVDLSPKTIEKTRRVVMQKGYDHVKLHCMAAHEIEQLREDTFDVVIINSVVQSFSGHNYLRHVLKKSMNCLHEKGVIFVGDVQDAALKDSLVHSLRTFQEQDRAHAVNTKLDWSNELFVSREFFNAIPSCFPEVGYVEISDKHGSVKNELTDFRFDALLHVDKKHAGRRQSHIEKRQFDTRELRSQSSAFNYIPHGAEDVAYVLYTSGTTGEPKGVEVKYSGLNNYVQWANRYYFGNRQGFHFPLCTALTFDLTITSVYSPLVKGDKLLLFEDMEVDVVLRNVFDPRTEVNCVKLTPSHINVVADLNLENTNVATVILGGEAINEGHVQVLRRLNPAVRIYNEYGPTEATVGCIAGEVEKLESIESVGKPVANTAIFILDDAKNVVPQHTIGEIFIVGDCLAKGYLNRPDLTASKFVNVTIDNVKRRAYKSGDLGKWNAKGEVEFLGRKDDQIKVRGHRIEISEVENICRRVLRINDCVVTTLMDESGDLMLVFYFMWTTNDYPQADTLRQQLSDYLPDFMMPSHYVPLRTWPLNTHGKINRKALPSPISEERRALVMPENDTERALLQIWKRVLAKDQISTKHNFFDLGGHSLKATRIVSSIFRELHVKIGLKEIFAKPTIKQLAHEIIASRKTPFERISPTTVNADGCYELSCAQRRIWVLSNIENAALAYIEWVGYELAGSVNSDILQDALRKLVDRHEILRTVFEMKQGRPVQRVLCAGDLSIEIIFQEGERKVSGCLPPAASINFDLSNGPLFQLYLVRYSDRSHTLWLNIHHIIFDGWSSMVFINDLLNVYQNIADETNSAFLSPLTIQYKDFSVHQMEQLKAPSSNVDFLYWKEKLSGELPILELPGYQSRPALQTFNGKTLTFSFDKKFSNDLNSFSQSSEVSLFMTLCSLMNVVFYKYTGQTDIIVGTSVAGRASELLENQIGFYLNMLALRNELSEDETFSDFLGTVKRNTIDAFEHQDYPFDQLVDELDLRRDLSRSAVFDVLVELHNFYPANLSTRASIQAKPFETRKDSSPVDLNLSFYEADTLQLTVVFNTDLFTDKQIERMVMHFETLAVNVMNHPSTPLKACSILSEEEKRQLLVEFNETKQVHYQETESILSRFETRVAENPDGIAIIFGEKSITYAELDEHSEIIAANLSSKVSLSSDDLIVVMMDRSPDIVVLILAIWKCGAAYVPIEPGFPTNRIQAIVDNCEPKMVVCNASVDQRVVEALRTNAIILFTETLTNKIPFTKRQVKGAYLAYVIYTSGSTGEPKGVMIEHVGMLNHIDAKIDELQMDRNSIVAQNASQCFDISAWQFFAPLLTGGKTVIYPTDLVLDPYAFVSALHVHRVSILEVVPSYLLQLLVVLEERRPCFPFHDLRFLIVNAETFKPGLAKRWFDLYTDVMVINTYGATEVSDDTSHYIMTAPPSDTETTPVMYRPIQNFSLYIVDEHMNLQPIGAKGEICISGIGTGRGYLNNIEQTNAVFIPNPFNSNLSHKLYKTGDIGRYLDDGRLEFLGRKDTQVKIKGYRVELGEIEIKLAQVTDVKDSAVIVRVGAEDEVYLCGYVVMGHVAHPLASNAIKKELAEMLPTYMVPSVIVQLASMPLNNNGKIDKNLLPDPPMLVLEEQTDHVAAQTALEYELLSTWKKILGRENIGIRNNFFEEGGDSIKAIQLASSMYRLGLKLEIKDIFKHPTIEALALQLKPLDTNIDQQAIVGQVPLSPAQQEFFTQFGFEHQFNMSLMITLKDNLDDNTIGHVFKKLQDHHDTLRSVFTSDDGAVMQYSRDLTTSLSLRSHDLKSEGRTEDHVDINLLAGEAQKMLNLSTGPLFHIEIIRLHDATKILLVVHHLVIDGISWRIILEDLNLLLSQARTGMPLSLPLKTNAFRNWTNDITRHAHSEACMRELAFWEDIDQRIQPLLWLNGIAQENIGLRKNQLAHFTLSALLTTSLLTTASVPFNTEINDLLLAALALAFKEQTGEETLAITLEGHGREHGPSDLNISRTVGWFSCEYPIILSVANDLTSHIEDVKEMLHRVPARGVNYGILRHIRGLHKALKHMPQVRFNYFGEIHEQHDEQLFTIDTTEIMNTENPNLSRQYDIEIKGVVRDGCLKITIDCAGSDLYSNRAKMLATSYENALEQIIEHCESREHIQLTPVDLTYKELSREDLDTLDSLFK